MEALIAATQSEAEARNHHYRTIIDFCLDKAASVYEECCALERKKKPDEKAKAFLEKGHGENLLFILAQAETPPHTRTKRLLLIAQKSCPTYNASDQRVLTHRLVGSTEARPSNANSETHWKREKVALGEAVGKARWHKATSIVVDWWIAATVRQDDALMDILQEEAARYLDDLCHYVASASTLWQESPKQVRLVVNQENRLYFITHLFFVLTKWCRDAPLATVAAKPRLRRWLAYMHEVYVIVMENEDELAKHYALEIVLEIAMCLRFYWELYGDRLALLTTQLINTPLEEHGFVVMPNSNIHCHGSEYFPVAVYHTHCLVAFFLTHSIATPSAFQQWAQ
jgi:hypothetical protein